MTRKRHYIVSCIIAALFSQWLIAAHAGWFGPDCDTSEFNKSEKVRQVDENASFSITVPKSWSVRKKKEDGYSEMFIKASGSCKITILISSRPLENNEKAVTVMRLIDSMLQSSLDHLRSQGHKIMNYGMYKEFKPGWPSFAIISDESDEKRIGLSIGTVIENRNYAINLLTRNEQHSEGLAAILQNVIESFEVL